MGLIDNNPFKVVRALVSMGRLMRDPNRLDEVFALADTMRDPSFTRPIIEHVRKDPLAAQALRELPRMKRVDLAALRATPEGSLGRAFATHLDANGLDPGSLPYYAHDDVHSWVPAHLTETHDVWHALTGFGADVAGELGLQTFYLAQFPSRLASALLAVGFMKFAAGGDVPYEKMMNEIARGWVLGHRAKGIFGVRWDELWEVPLVEVRARFGIDVEGAARSVETGPVARERAVHAAADAARAVMH